LIPLDNEISTSIPASSIKLIKKPNNHSEQANNNNKLLLTFGLFPSSWLQQLSSFGNQLFKI